MLPRGSLAAHCLLWRTSSVFTASVEQPAHCKIQPTLDAVCLTRYPLVDALVQSSHRQTESKTVFTPEPLVTVTFQLHLCIYFGIYLCV